MDVEEELNENHDFDKSGFLHTCLRLVAEGKITSSVFDDSGFKSLIKIHEKRLGTNLNSSSIESMLNRCDEESWEITKKYNESELSSLSFHHFYQNSETNGFIGVSMRYEEDEMMCNRYLGFIALPKPFSGSELKTEILKFLENYELSPSKIFASTTDRVITLRNKELDESEWCELQDLNQKIHDCIAELFPVFRCPAYHLQSAVNDVMSPVAQKITECRSLLKELEKMPGFDFKSSELRLCNRTDQWESLHEMFASILKQKNLIDSVLGDANNQLTKIDWNFILDIVNVLGPLKNIFRESFTSQHEIGNFYLNWMGGELRMEKIGRKNPFAFPLRDAMEKKRNFLFENDILLASLYLDARINYIGSNILSEEHKTRALNRLVKTFNTIENLKKDYGSHDSGNASAASATTPDSSKMFHAELERRIKRDTKMRTKLIRFSKRKMAPIDTCSNTCPCNHSDEYEDISEIYSTTATVVSDHDYAKHGFYDLPDEQIQTLSGADVKRLNHFVSMNTISSSGLYGSEFFEGFE